MFQTRGPKGKWKKQKEQGLKTSSCEFAWASNWRMTNRLKSSSCYSELKNIEVLNAFKESVVEDVVESLLLHRFC